MGPEPPEGGPTVRGVGGSEQEETGEGADVDKSHEPQEEEKGLEKELPSTIQKAADDTVIRGERAHT